LDGFPSDKMAHSAQDCLWYKTRVTSESVITTQVCFVKPEPYHGIVIRRMA